MLRLPRKRSTGLAGWATLLLLAAALPARAQLQEGDVLVMDLVGNRIVKVDPVSGAQTLVPTGGSIPGPSGMAVDRNGFLFVTRWLQIGDATVVRARPDQNTQINITNIFTFPESIAVTPDDQIYVSESFSNVARVWRLDRATGLAEQVAQGGNMVFILGMVVDPDGKHLLVADPNVLVDNGRGVFRIDPDNFDPNNTIANQEIVSQDGLFAQPDRLATSGASDLFVTDLGGERADMVTVPPQVIHVDMSNSDPQANQTVVAQGGLLNTPIGIAVESAGTLLVSDAVAGLIRIDPDSYDEMNPSANQTAIPPGGMLTVPWEMLIVPELDPAITDPFYVTDAGPAASDDAVYLVHPGTDSRSPVSAEGFFVNPVGLAPASDGDLLVTDTGIPGLVKVDLDTPFAPGDPGANQTLISSGGLLVEPMDVVEDAGGDYLVIDAGIPALVRITPGGVQSIVTSPAAQNEDDFFVRPVGLVSDASGYLLVADAGADPSDPTNNPGSILRVSPTSGRQQCIDRTFGLAGLSSIARDEADGTYVMAGPPLTPVVRLAGSILLETSSTLYQTPRGIAADTNRDVLVVDAGDAVALDDGVVRRLDVLELDPTEVPAGGPFSDPSGIVMQDASVPEVLPFIDDMDGDGIGDLEDNCIETPNPDQLNTNPLVDNYGNACDGDFNQDFVAGGPDYLILLQQFGKTDEDPLFEPGADLSGDGVIGGPDFLAFFALWNTVPGPSGDFSEIVRACPVE